MISLLQVFRGLAALLVVYHHANQEVIARFGDNWWRSLFDLGDAGVQFFFVLSGFIIYYVHRDDIGRPARAKRFFLKRIIRIYPIYILITLVLTPIWAFVPGFGAPYHKELSSFIFSLLLLPQDHVPNLGVAWTLIHEMLFYSLFTLVVLHRGIGRTVFAAWFGAIAVAALLLPDDPPNPWSVLLSVNNLLFGLGILAATLVVHRPWQRDLGWPWVILGSGAFIATGVAANLLAEAGYQNPAIARLVILLLGLASFVIVLQSGSRSVERDFGRWRLLNAIGAASFSIYLIHQPAMSAGGKVMNLLGLEALLGPNATFIVLIVGSVAVGMAMYRWLERPMLRHLTARFVAPRQRMVSAQPVA